MSGQAGASAARASLMLVLVTVVWGVSFTWTRSWQLAVREAPGGELLWSLTLIMLRMPLALAVFALWQPRLLVAPSWAEYRGGLLLGAVFFGGFALQTWGLASTTPALSAFFTSLCSAWVPVVGYVLYRERVAPLTLAGLALALVGCAVLVDGWRIGRGEGLTLLGSFLFTGQVIVLDRLGKHLVPAHLTPGFILATGGLACLGAMVLATREPGLGVWLEWMGTLLGQRDILLGLLCLACFSTVLGFHWMNTYQPLVPATRAALIYLLEPVFSAIFSVWWGHDTLTQPLVLGGVLILGGNLLVELPGLLRARRTVPDEEKAPARESPPGL
ncbi:MAG: DMT family transporter [Gemmataceae bacterium]